MRTKEEILSTFKNRFGKIFADKQEYLLIELLCDVRDAIDEEFIAKRRD